MSDLPIPEIPPVPIPAPDIVPGSGGTGSDKKLYYVFGALAFTAIVLTFYAANKRKAQNVPKEPAQH